MRYPLLFLVYLFFHVQIFAQQGRDTTSFPFVGFHPHVAYILPHAAELKNISRSRPIGLQAEYGYLLTSNKAYAQTRSICRLGLAIQFTDFGNRQTLGSASTLSAYLEPYLVRQKAFHCTFRFGFGGVYLSRVYDSINNPENLFFSSRLSFLAYLASSIRYQLAPRWKLIGSMIYNHISNGGVKMPNKGMNFPAVSMGVEYLPFGEKFRKPVLTNKSSRFWSLYVESGGSIKNTPSDWGAYAGLSTILNVACMVEKKVSTVHGFSLGLEFTSDGYMQNKFLFDNMDINHNTLGFGPGHTFELGKIRITQQYFLYLFNEDPQKRISYQRYGMFYHLTPIFYFGGTLKVHRHIADMFDVRLGYRFLKTKNR